MDILTKYSAATKEERPFNHYFGLSNSTLNFIQTERHSIDMGCSDEGNVFVPSINGKMKINLKEFASFLIESKPNRFVVPYEFIDSSCSNKRLKRSVDKSLKFLKDYDFPESDVIFPLFIDIPEFMDYVDELIFHPKITGFIVFGTKITDELTVKLKGKTVIYNGLGKINELKEIKGITEFVLKFSFN